MEGKFNNIEIAGIAVAVPEKVVDNDIYTKILGERRVRKQGKLTGIMQTHISPSWMRTSDLCYAAAKRLLEHLEWNPQEISVLIFATQTPNYKAPSTAFFLQKRLKIGEDCLVYDMNMGCSAFNVGVQAAAVHLITMPKGSKALVLVGDDCIGLTSERNMNPETIKNTMLFGSAGAAIAVETVSDNAYFKYMLKSKGENFSAIICFRDRPTEMEGNCVLDFAINEVSDDILKFEKELKSEDKEVDYYVLHQAQKLIVDSIVDTCGMDENKVLNSYANFGNTSGASIPLSICANIDKFSDKEYIRALMSGFGVGLSWTILYTKLRISGILPVIYTDEHFDEDKRAEKYLWNRSIIFLGTDDEVNYSVLEQMNVYSIENAISIGTNIEQLEDVSNNSVSKNTILQIERNDIQLSAEQFVQANLYADGVVVPLSKYSVDDVIWFVNYIDEKNLFKCRYPSVILLDEYGTTMEKEQILEKCFAGFNNKSTRVNMIMYHKDSLQYVRKLGRDTDWVMEFINSGFDLKMLRIMDIGNMVYYLMSENIYFVNRTVFKIDDKIESSEPII